MNKQTFGTLIFFATIFFFASACKKDNKGTDETPKNGYMLAIGVETPDGTGFYLVPKNSLDSGVVSATGQGHELQSDQVIFGKAGKTYITWNAFEDPQGILQGFNFENGTFTSTGQAPMDWWPNKVKSVGDKAVMLFQRGASGDEHHFITVSENGIVSQDKAPYTYKLYDGSGKFVSMMYDFYVSGDKLYATFWPMSWNQPDWTTPADTCYMSVYSYPELEYITTFTDARTGPAGSYAHRPFIVENEGGDLFTLSPCSNAAGSTEHPKPSGILKVKKGAVKFEEDYFFDVEALGYKVQSGEYAGNGKLIARVTPKEVDETVDAWTVWDPINYLAILDLNAKTIDIVDDIPLHGEQSYTWFLKEGGKVYTSVQNESGTFIYKIDPATATSVKGARVEGVAEVRAVYKY